MYYLESVLTSASRPPWGWCGQVVDGRLKEGEGGCHYHFLVTRTTYNVRFLAPCTTTAMMVVHYSAAKYECLSGLSSAPRRRIKPYAQLCLYPLVHAPCGAHALVRCSRPRANRGSDAPWSMPCCPRRFELPPFFQSAEWTRVQGSVVRSSPWRRDENSPRARACGMPCRGMACPRETPMGCDGTLYPVVFTLSSQTQSKRYGI